MNEPPPVSPITAKWFDALEAHLHAGAKLAGLFSHGGMKGNAREFFVKRALQTVLPPSLHIGTGKIIGHDGTESRQIDVVVYDPAFPVFESSPGHGLYMVEGVIAAIEVKSTLDETKLREALDNCDSVAQVSTSLSAERLIEKQGKEVSLGHFPLRPVSYIFGYSTSAKRAGTFTTHIRKWIDDHEYKSGDTHRLPQVIIGGRFLVITAGPTFTINAPKIEGEEDMVAVWETDSRFGWMLTHLLDAVAYRSSKAVQLSFRKYAPIAYYSERDIKGADYWALIDKQPSPPTAPGI